MRMVPLAGVASLLLLLPATGQAATSPCELEGAQIVAGNAKVAVLQQTVKGEPEQVDIVGEDKPVTVRDETTRLWFCALRSGAKTKIGTDADRPSLWRSSTVVAGRFAGVKVEWDAPSGAPNRTVAVMIFDARTGKIVATESAERPYKCSCAGVGSFVLNRKGAYAFTNEPGYDRTEVWKVVHGKRTLLERSTDGSDPAKPDSASLAMADGTYLYWHDEADERVSTARLPWAGNPYTPRKGRGAPCGVQGAAVVERNAKVAVLLRETGERRETWVCSLGNGDRTRLGAGDAQVDVFDWDLAGRFAAILVNRAVPGAYASIRTLYVYDARKGAVVATESVDVDGHCQCAGLDSFVVRPDGDYAFITWPADQRQQVIEVVDGQRTVLAEGRNGDGTAPQTASLATDRDGLRLYWSLGGRPGAAAFADF